MLYLSNLFVQTNKLYQYSSRMQAKRYYVYV